jgi:AcrR family transcriptional regulator
MRASVAVRGVAGSTFDQVASEAGVSRGLLHYYFGTKERLLIEVVRRECDIRSEALDEAIDAAGNCDDVIAAMVGTFEAVGSTSSVMFYEMMTLSRRHEEIAAEFAELGRKLRTHLRDALVRKQEAGVLKLCSADPDCVATFLFALGDGLMVRRLSEPDVDLAPVIGQAVIAARALIS